MSRPGRKIRRFVIDTNVFVAAINPFTKSVRKARRDANTLRLVIRSLLTDEQIELVGNTRLVNEYHRLAENLNPPTTRMILQHLVAKIKVTELDEQVLKRCKPYIPGKESADVMHAATTLQTRSVLITNDTDFDKIKKEGRNN